MLCQKTKDNALLWKVWKFLPPLPDASAWAKLRVSWKIYLLNMLTRKILIGLLKYKKKALNNPNNIWKRLKKIQKKNYAEPVCLWCLFTDALNIFTVYIKNSYATTKKLKRSTTLWPCALSYPQ